MRIAVRAGPTPPDPMTPAHTGQVCGGSTGVPHIGRSDRRPMAESGTGVPFAAILTTSSESLTPGKDPARRCVTTVKVNNYVA
jgi:hypothetical protein